MKKSILSIFAISTLLFTSCGENGTSTEVAESRGEVNSDQINGYGQDPAHSSATEDQGPEMVWMDRAENIAGQMARDLQLDRDKQDEVQQIIYERERKLGEAEDELNYSETARMGGESDNDTRNDMSNNNNTNMNADRSNNAGNAYTGNSAVNDEAGNNLDMRESEMNEQRKQIKDETDTQLQEVLSADQFKMYKQNHDKYSTMSSDASSGQSSQMKQPSANQ
ncbi:hypothetical protein [Pontibacter sp. SGAir0037]|uniref:hypothetical protein n=1 Tax=Pontibacter sp. SGAir0037 TaxID=2571030 RepID=UPI0010CCBF7F|nr:hypothetical protein [Pontibacter sp. SGAir0037]QCR23567.1 hypothetical protein C1N53_15260 [Pontibacter sp. SGAir0037]